MTAANVRKGRNSLRFEVSLGQRADNNKWQVVVDLLFNGKVCRTDTSEKQFDSSEEASAWAESGAVQDLVRYLISQAKEFLPEARFFRVYKGGKT